jgi:hypothetical protein
MAVSYVSNVAQRTMVAICEDVVGLRQTEVEVGNLVRISGTFFCGRW